MNILDNLHKKKITILGDVIADHYVDGDVLRISPEAPVAVLNVRAERFAPGGAANVAANAANLGAEVTLIGALGTDLAGDHLLRSLAKFDDRINCQLTRVEGRPTTTKTRYLGDRHQLLRVDREVCSEFHTEVETAILEALKRFIPDSKVLVLSDYGKGGLSTNVLRDAIGIANTAAVPIVVDPKRVDYRYYRGATIITPNRKELFAATGLPCDTDTEAEIAAAAAIAASGAAILLTRSEQGMSYFASRLPPLHCAAEAREVFDVSGAGDTVVAVLAFALANELNMDQAMRLANAAASIVVGKQGTALVSQTELRRALARDDARAPSAKVLLDHSEALSVCKRWRTQGLTIGFANGCFDLLHPGHIHLIQTAATACDRLIVALNSDKSVRRLKGPTRPTQNEDARARVMSGLQGVDLVTIFDDDTPLALIEALEPDVIIKGGDWREHDVVGGNFVKSRGGRVLLVDLSAGHSTTVLTDRIAQLRT